MAGRIVVLLCVPYLSAAAHGDSAGWQELIDSAGQAKRAGRYYRAKELMTAALAKAENFDVADPRRMGSKLLLAESLLELGEYGQCKTLCTELIASLKKQQAGERMEIARAEKLLARTYLQLRISWLADEHCKRGLKICESLLGKQHPAVAEFHVLMGQIWNLDGSGGDNNGANRSREILEAAYGKSDPRLLDTLEALAGDCYDRWRPAYAARAVKIAEAVYGKRHPMYGRCLSTLATAYRHQQDFEQSQLFSDRAIEILSDSLGPAHPLLSPAYRNLASIERERGHSDQADAYFRKSVRLRFSALSDTEMCQFFDQIIETDKYEYYGEDVSDIYLTDMIRRGSHVIEKYLTHTIETRKQQFLEAARAFDQSEDIKEFDTLLDRKTRYSKNLELVTALCRVQRKPDPLQISVEGADALSCEFPELPVLDVTIANVDVEKREIGFKEAGNHRSGRQARWRIEVTDAAGKVQPPKRLYGLIHGGGIFDDATLKAGEGWQTALVMMRFVDTLEPGEYRVRVLYHNYLTIVNREFTTGLIVCRSEPFKLTVRRRSVHVTGKQRKTVHEILARFDDRQLCKIVDGKYDEWAHEFVQPDSDYGRLLTLGWPAVPPLIEELEREGQSAARRAHLLALLFSITGENDPRPPGLIRNSAALGKYSMVKQGWAVSSKRVGEDEPSQQGFGFAADPITYDGDLDANAQTPFIDRWQAFLKQLDLTRDD